jgi:multicomponent Na+:H+ antiporter subunit A
MIPAQSAVLPLAVRVTSPLALVLAAYLFFAGHNSPGGGFAAGLVLGAVVALRIVGGLQQPRHTIALLAGGGILAAGIAIIPLVFGEPLLDQVIVERTVPVLGKVKSGSALIFDAGVTLIVVGLVVAVLDGLGIEDLAEPDPGDDDQTDGALAQEAESS